MYRFKVSAGLAAVAVFCVVALVAPATGSAASAGITLSSPAVNQLSAKDPCEPPIDPYGCRKVTSLVRSVGADLVSRLKEPCEPPIDPYACRKVTGLVAEVLAFLAPPTPTPAPAPGPAQ